MLRITLSAIVTLLTLLMLGGIAALVIINLYSQDLPDYKQLEDYEPPIVTRLYAGDGRLMTEYAVEKRVFVPIKAMPKRVINAFLSAEDKSFYSHRGVDFRGIMRAAITNLLNLGQGSGGLAGGSTITQQVVKNLLLTNEQSIERKIKEAILAFRISKVFSKDRILELYLNEIYLGAGSYGVAAAALNYFNKSLDELTIEEAALLAALPKAPSTYDPRRNPKDAQIRRDWVIRRMVEDGNISDEEADRARATPITLRARDRTEIVDVPFFSEEVRRQLAAMYGERVLYEGGLTVRTTLNPEVQKMAEYALRSALITYDQRHGYRGPIARLDMKQAWEPQLAALPGKETIPLHDRQRLAVVTAVKAGEAEIGLENGMKGKIPLAAMQWARKKISDRAIGPEVRKAGDVVATGDVVIVYPLNPDAEEDIKKSAEYGLFQIPEINGGMVVMDPHTGRVLAMAGGYSHKRTEFNRATQARRQPGSAFKPFIYLTGLERGFTPTSIINDSPISLYQGPGLPYWSPKNYTNDFLGPTTMRVGVEKSRNAMTVHLAQMVGIDRIISLAKRFDIYNTLPRNYSIVLGAAETTLMRLTNAYAILVGGGKRLKPSLIERIQDRNGKIIFRRDTRECSGCLVQDATARLSLTPPEIIDTREQVVDPRLAYQMVSILEGVVQRGTATAAKELGYPMGGKTGTTNDSIDAWFIGFTPDLVAGVYVGFDKPRSLGYKETGGRTALPAFIEFMKLALKNKPVTPFRIPDGIRLVRVSPYSGRPASSGNVIFEAYVADPSTLFLPDKPKETAKPEGSEEEENTGDTAPVQSPAGTQDNYDYYGAGTDGSTGGEEPSVYPITPGPRDSYGTGNGNTPTGRPAQTPVYGTGGLY
jgi:penicillin-binding protein 1A